MPAIRHTTVAPSAARLTRSLRDIGYDFASAVADLVDNSIAAGATKIRLESLFNGVDSRIVIADNGDGMTANGVAEAFRFGSRRSYVRGELGRYGLGLKTASLSQCRAVTVASRRRNGVRIVVRQLDLELIEDYDEWIIQDPGLTEGVRHAKALLRECPGTVIVWEDLDRIIPDDRPDGGWARRRLATLIGKAAEHLSAVFHRYLEVGGDQTDIEILVDGEPLKPWNPFAIDEPKLQQLPSQKFEITVGDLTGSVSLDRFVLPNREVFSSPAEFDRMSGPSKWNRQQGIYVYRAGRLVQWGGWAGLRAIDEHTKLGRAALRFDTDLDAIFNINVAKMRVAVPAQLRQMLERPIQELCLAAQDAYRRTPRNREEPETEISTGRTSSIAISATAGLALRSAALVTGGYDALKRIADFIRQTDPELVSAIGLDGL